MSGSQSVLSGKLYEMTILCRILRPKSGIMAQETGRQRPACRQDKAGLSRRGVSLPETHLPHTPVFSAFATSLSARDRNELTVRHYLSDLLQFIGWFDGTLGQPFRVEAVSEYGVRTWRDDLVARLEAASFNPKLPAWGPSTDGQTKPGRTREPYPPPPRRVAAGRLRRSTPEKKPSRVSCTRHVRSGV